MKKFLKTLKRKKFNLKHSRKCRIKSFRFKQNKKKKNRSLIGLKKKQRETKIKSDNRFDGYTKIKAPQNFSLKSNTENVLNFIEKIRACFEKRRRVFVVLKDVVEIDHDSIVVLLSILVRFKSQKIDFNGNFPTNKIAHRILAESGFFRSLYKQFKDETSYSLGKENFNLIHTHANKNVDSELGANVIKQASLTIWGEERRCQGVQRALIELMLNTNNHATYDKEGDKHWWLSVNHDKKNKRVSFSFVDYGVGIFNSLENKPDNSKFFGVLKRMKQIFNFTNNSELLKLILNGELHKTVTGQYYRGKGLHGIFEALKRNSFSNLYIISNDVYANVDKSVYKMLNSKLNGTFIYWDLSVENLSCLNYGSN